MLNTKSLTQFEYLDQDKLFKPIYKDYSFANIAPTIFYLLTRKKTGKLLPKDCFKQHNYPQVKKVVLFFIDSFGFLFWQKYFKKFKVLETISQSGVATPISALFPSTTAASVSAINFGVLPSRHGLFEWNMYFEEYDDVIQTLPFSPLGSKKIDECLKLGYNPKYLLLRKKTIYEDLFKKGCRSYQFYRKEYSNSSYNKMIAKGAEVSAYSKLAEGLVNLKKLLESKDEKLFAYFYHGDIDSVGHEYGPGSVHHDAQIAEFWLTFDYVFSQFKKSDDTLFLFTSDHGQVYIDPKNTYYLNLEIPEIVDYLRPNKKSNIICPVGSARDVFLHVRDEKVTELVNLLQNKLKGKAKVMLISEVLNEGLFGPPPYEEIFIRRLGQILILPYHGQYVWWYEKDKLEMKHYGHHGGLTREEMLTVFASF